MCFRISPEGQDQLDRDNTIKLIGLNFHDLLLSEHSLSLIQRLDASVLVLWGVANPETVRSFLARWPNTLSGTGGVMVLYNQQWYCPHSFALRGSAGGGGIITQMRHNTGRTVLLGSFDVRAQEVWDDFFFTLSLLPRSVDEELLAVGHSSTRPSNLPEDWREFSEGQTVSLHQGMQPVVRFQFLEGVESLEVTLT